MAFDREDLEDAIDRVERAIDALLEAERYLANVYGQLDGTGQEKCMASLIMDIERIRPDR